MFDAIPVKRADVACLVAATFPNYRGRRISLQPAKTIGLHDLNWSGGTRCQYKTCTITGQAIGNSSKYAAMAPWENIAEGTTLPIPQGCVVVQHSIFQGKDTGLAIYAHPDDFAALIEQRVAA